MLLRFTKMHGLGNDFVLLDLISQHLQLRPEQIRHMADRRTGIGFDQLLVVQPPEDPAADFKYRIFNADGTEAEQCGNGARCFMLFVRDQGLTLKTQVTLQTSTGLITCTLNEDSTVSVDMGVPVLEPQGIPFIADPARASDADKKPQTLHRLNLPATHSCGEHPVDLVVVNMGNPHAVVMVDDIDNAPVSTIGARIASHPRFPAGVNVGFMKIDNRQAVQLRVLERGVGETRACGTGACAAVVAGRLVGQLDAEVTVTLPGGELTINWPGEHQPLIMTGSACRVYDGRLQL